MPIRFGQMTLGTSELLPITAHNNQPVSGISYTATEMCFTSGVWQQQSSNASIGLLRHATQRAIIHIPFILTLSIALCNSYS